MNIVCVQAQAMAPQAWSNGGGQTRELMAWPAGKPWQVRISRADIGSDGPFSAFPGVQRWFTVLRGAGVELSFADRRRELRIGDSPLAFDGATAPGCRLLDGATQDLNLMVRAGSGVMCQTRPGQTWPGDFSMRGLYSTICGSWSGNGHTRSVPAHSLLWVSDAAPGGWTFNPRQDSGHTGLSWWLGFTPEE